MASTQTTFLGPLVSLSTSAVDGGTVPHLLIPSSATITFAGSATNSGTFTNSGTITSTGLIDSNSTFDNAGGKFLSRQTTASLTSLTLADGELAVDNVSVSSCVLRFRSGNTTYTFRADAAAVL